MQCKYNSLIQIINFHGLFRNAPRCRKSGACPILVFLRYNDNTLVPAKKDVCLVSFQIQIIVQRIPFEYENITSVQSFSGENNGEQERKNFHP